MNNNRIRHSVCNFRSSNDAQLELQNSCCGNYSSREVSGAGPPVQRARKNSPDLMVTGSRCVGSTPGAFYAAERLMGFPHFEDGIDTLPPSAKDSMRVPSFGNQEAQLSMNGEKQNSSIPCAQGTLESLVKLPVQGSYSSAVFDDGHRFTHGSPQNCVVSVILAFIGSLVHLDMLTIVFDIIFHTDGLNYSLLD